MKYQVINDLVFNEPRSNGKDLKITLRSGEVVEYARPETMSAEDRSWYEDFIKRRKSPRWRLFSTQPQRIIPFIWRGRVRYANCPDDLRPCSTGVVNRFV